MTVARQSQRATLLSDGNVLITGSGQTNIMLAKAMAEQPEMASRLGQPIFIVFDSDDIRADSERIRSHGGRIASGPEPAHWGDGKPMEAIAADPDGNGFVLVQPG